MTRGLNARHVAAAAVVATLAWVQPGSAQTAPQRGGTAIFTISGDPSNMNPDLGSNTPDRQVGCIMYQGLVQLSTDYDVQPLLAKSWQVSPDGLTYSFDLVHTNWHDGQPFTSDDVKYTLTEIAPKYSSVFRAAGRAIESIETPAPDKVVIKLKQPFGPFLISLGCIQGAAIMPAHILRGTDPMKNSDFSAHPVGTGAFKVTEWVRGDHVTFTRNPDYYESGKPYLDRIIAKVIPQSTTRVQALLAGEVDLTHYLELSALDALRKNPNVAVLNSDSAPNSVMAFLNTQHKPLDDKRVRQALFVATDTNYIWKNIYFGVGSPGIAPFTTEISWAANPDVDFRKMYAYDPARANKMLDDAGYTRGPDGKRFRLHVLVYAAQFAELQLVAVAMKNMWQAVGVDLNIDSLEDATLNKRMADGDFDMTYLSYTSFSDPALGVARTFVSATIGQAFGNLARYSNPEIDRLFAEGEKPTSTQDRGLFYKQAQAILAEDVPVITFLQRRETMAVSKSLHDIAGKVQGLGDWVNAWIEH